MSGAADRQRDEVARPGALGDARGDAGSGGGRRRPAGSTAPAPRPAAVPRSRAPPRDVAECRAAVQSCSERTSRLPRPSASMPCTAAASSWTVVMIGRSIAMAAGADLVAVGAGAAAGRRVDHHVDLAGEDPLDDRRLAVGPAAGAVLADHGRPRRRCGAARRRCPSVARISKPRSASRLTGKIMARLSRLATETKTAPLVGSPPYAADCDLANAVPKSASMPITSPVERISGPEHVVDAAPLDGPEPLERQHRLLDRRSARATRQRRPPSPVRGQQALGAQLGDRRAEHHPGGRLGQRHAGRLRDERHRARGPRVRLQHVEDVGGQRELHVEQPADADAAGDRQRSARGPARAPSPAEGDRRQHAGRVAGVDAGLLDVLHDAAEVQLLAVVAARRRRSRSRRRGSGRPGPGARADDLGGLARCRRRACSSS